MSCKLCSTVWGPNADEIQLDVVLSGLLNNLFSELDCQLPVHNRPRPSQATMGVAKVCKCNIKTPTGRRVIPCCVPPRVPSRRHRSTEYQHRLSFVPKQAKPASNKNLNQTGDTESTAQQAVRPQRPAKPETLNDPPQTVPAPC